VKLFFENQINKKGENKKNRTVESEKRKKNK
jgi:hypothetical protein